MRSNRFTKIENFSLFPGIPNFIIILFICLSLSAALYFSMGAIISISGHISLTKLIKIFTIPLTAGVFIGFIGRKFINKLIYNIYKFIALRGSRKAISKLSAMDTKQ